MTCARCDGEGKEEDGHGTRAPCAMCKGSGDAVGCSQVIRYTHQIRARCGRPSVGWDDESPRCEEHIPAKKDELPSTADLSRSDRDFTRGRSTEEFLRRIRSD